MAFGGGFIALKLLREVFVKKLTWVADAEMDDYTAVAQASPGSIALNVSILVGLKTAGFLGMLATVIGSVIPPFAVITGLYYFYDAVKGLAFFFRFNEGYASRGCRGNTMPYFRYSRKHGVEKECV